MEAGAVHFGCGGGERGRDRSAPTGDHPVRLGEREPDPVRDLPDRGGAPEESLDLVTARHGELRGDGAPPAAVDVAQARPHAPFAPCAPSRLTRAPGAEPAVGGRGSATKTARACPPAGILK